MVLEKQLGGEAEPWQQDERKQMRCKVNMQVCRVVATFAAVA